MEKLFELSCQDQTLTPQVGTFTDTSQTTGTFTLEDGEYYLTNADSKGFYTYKPVAMQSGLVDDGKVIIEFDLKVVTASVNTHAIIGTYAGVDGNGVPTGAKITLQYNAGDIELVLGSGTTETLIESADVVVDQWYHFRIDCALTAAIESTYEVKIDGTAVATVIGATTDYALGIISVLGTDLHACDECGIKNLTFVTETNLYVGRTALDQALQDVKGYVDAHTPTVNDGTLTIQQNGTTVQTFTANQSTAATANITVPTATSELTNDSGFITSEIDSMDTGWVRFKSGLQICYGKATNTNALATGTTRFSFPKIFNITPSVITTPDISSAYGCTAFTEGASTWVLNVYNAVNGILQKTPDHVPCQYVAIGTWK